VRDLDAWNLSDAEFEAVMAEIDAELRQENDRIVGREVRGWAKFCQRFRISIALGEPLADRIVDWFKALYGDRLNVDFDFGKSYVVIRGDTYRVRCFRFYGVMYAICSVQMAGRRICQRTPHDVERAVVNLLDDSVEGLTPELVRRLSPPECCEILTRYRYMYQAFSAIEGALSARYGGTDAPYMKEAMDDLLESAECMLLRTPNYGQSNWAALQATEKILKSYLLEMGRCHGKSHNLEELCAHASAAGLQPINPTLIKAIQCKADVRYDSQLVTKDKAVAAHEAALIVCGETAKYIRRSTAQASVTNVQIRIDGHPAIDGLMLAYQPPTPPFITKGGTEKIGPSTP
jgi:hypothetical protein